MKVSYESEELIEEVLEDIDLFGEEDEVFAIYSYFEVVDAEKLTLSLSQTIFQQLNPLERAQAFPGMQKMNKSIKTN